MKENDETKQDEMIETEVDFGFSNDGASKYAQVYFVKPRLKDKPLFELTWKVGDKKYISTTQKLQGRLIKIEQSSYVYGEETIETLKFHLEWMNKAEEPILFIMGSSYTSVMRNLLNTLLACKEPVEKLSLSLYSNNDGYASLYTLINGKKGEWKYDWKKLNEKVEEVKTKAGKVISREYSELNEFLKDELFGMVDTLIEGHMVVIPEQDAEKYFDKPKPKKSNKSDVINEPDEMDYFGDKDATMDDDFNLDVN